MRQDHDLQWRRQQLSPEWKARLYRPGVRLSTDVSPGARFRELHEDPPKEADRECGAASLLQMPGRDDHAVSQEKRWDLTAPLLPVLLSMPRLSEIWGDNSGANLAKGASVVVID